MALITASISVPSPVLPRLISSSSSSISPPVSPPIGIHGHARKGVPATGIQVRVSPTSHVRVGAGAVVHGWRWVGHTHWEGCIGYHGAVGVWCHHHLRRHVRIHGGGVDHGGWGAIGSCIHLPGKLLGSYVQSFTRNFTRSGGGTLGNRSACSSGSIATAGCSTSSTYGGAWFSIR